MTMIEKEINFVIEIKQGSFQTNWTGKMQSTWTQLAVGKLLLHLSLTAKAIVRQVNCAVHVADNLAEEVYRVR